ncbi:hypothetical protein CFII64_11139 [Pseudomonas sp. CFII64]|nr:hypothetical protein CFII64_11139 [Pseudomonas sp. CFII64]
MDAMAINNNPIGKSMEESLRASLFIGDRVHGHRAGGAMGDMMLNNQSLSNILLNGFLLI